MTETMNAVEITEAGGPEVLKLTTRPVPELPLSKLEPEVLPPRPLSPSLAGAAADPLDRLRAPTRVVYREPRRRRRRATCPGWKPRARW